MQAAILLYRAWNAGLKSIWPDERLRAREWFLSWQQGCSRATEPPRTIHLSAYNYVLKQIDGKGKAVACVLDLGCGQRIFLRSVQLSDNDILCGIDISHEDLLIARFEHPGHIFCCAKAESIPLRSGSVDRVICNVALPYMNIPVVLMELHRVMKPGATLSISLHSIFFTLAEFKLAFPRLVPLLFRSYVLLNGAWYHLTGRLIPFSKNRIESWQSESAITKSLLTAGFSSIQISYPDNTFVVDARRL